MLKFVAMLSFLSWLPSILEGAVDVVNDLEELTCKGEEKAKAAVKIVAAEIDEHADDVPGWGSLSEAARDRLVGGLVELALMVTRGVYGRKEASPAKARIDLARAKVDRVLPGAIRRTFAQRRAERKARRTATRTQGLGQAD